MKARKAMETKEQTVDQELSQLVGLSDMVLSPDTKRLLDLVLDAQPSAAQLSALLFALSNWLDPTETLAQRLREILPDISGR